MIITKLDWTSEPLHIVSPWGSLGTALPFTPPFHTEWCVHTFLIRLLGVIVQPLQGQGEGREQNLVMTIRVAILFTIHWQQRMKYVSAYIYTDREYVLWSASVRTYTLTENTITFPASSQASASGLFRPSHLLGSALMLLENARITSSK